MKKIAWLLAVPLVAAGFGLSACATAPKHAKTGAVARDVTPVTGEAARAAYERFKALDGQWTGDSTKGWTETITYRTIANGSAVMESSFDAHPGEQMLTLIHPDGERLLLTHYCAAKNQPRLCLTSIEDGGSKVTFEFMDATNLPSRDKGHMDKVVFRFIDGNTFTSRWTWYQDGKEKWMEDITHKRVGPATACAASSGALAPVAFITGEWSGVNNGKTIQESWNQASSNFMSATGRTIAGDKTVFHEYLRIIVKGDKLVYVAQPAGRAPTEFTLTKSEPNMAQFENPEHDFPKLIRYTLTDDTMTAYLEGVEKGQAKSEMFTMKRARMR